MWQQQIHATGCRDHALCQGANVREGDVVHQVLRQNVSEACRQLASQPSTPAPRATGSLACRCIVWQGLEAVSRR